MSSVEKALIEEWIESNRELTEAVKGLQAAFEVCPTPSEEETDPLDDAPKPWLKFGLKKRDYIALTLVDEHKGHPKSKDINQKFLEMGGYNDQKSGYAVAVPLNRLFKSGFVGRPEKQPYVYWVTHKGREVLKQVS